MEHQTQQKYGNVLARLVFNLMRASDPEWESPVQYPPLDSVQRAVISVLKDALERDDKSSIDDALQEVCYCLFAHEMRQYPASAHLASFASPVNVFLVYYSLGPNGNFKKSSEMTAICAALEYCIRMTILYEVEKVANEGNISAFTYVLFILFSSSIFLYLTHIS